MTTCADLKAIFAMGRPLVEQAIELSEEFAAIREAATAKGLDWSQVKALLKAQVMDERDGGDGKRVRKIIERADYASSYADMLGLGSPKMNENNFSAAPPVLKGAVGDISQTIPVAAIEHDEGIPEFLRRSS